jgi:hypothetical protein
MSLLFWKKKAAPAARTGTISVNRDPSGLLVIKVSGAISPDLMASAQQKILAAGNQGPKLRGLIDAAEIKGWVKGFDGGTAEIEKMFQIDDITERLAVVADKEWHEKLNLFLGVWTRKAPVKFFTIQEREAALRWLKS